MPSRAKIRGIIAKLEKQRRDLKEIITALREIRDLSPKGASDLSLNDHEKRLLSEALHRAEGNQSEAARITKSQPGQSAIQDGKARTEGQVRN